MSKQCAKCSKTVYPTEELKCLDKVWHKFCFKCTTCGMTLNLKNFQGFDRMPYCRAHTPKAKHTNVTDTPEINRVKEATKNQSLMSYHEDFEKNLKGTALQVADNLEMERLKKNQTHVSQACYHEQFEKDIRGHKIEVADDPETLRLLKNQNTISNITYHEQFEKGIKGHKIEVADDPETMRHLKNQTTFSDAAYHENFEKNFKGRATQIADDPETLRLLKNQNTFSNVRYQEEYIKSKAGKMPIEGEDQNYSQVEQNQSNRKVGSINDYDPLNEQYGSIAQGHQPYSSYGGQQWQETVPVSRVQAPDYANVIPGYSMQGYNVVSQDADQKGSINGHSKQQGFGAEQPQQAETQRARPSRIQQVSAQPQKEPNVPQQQQQSVPAAAAQNQSQAQISLQRQHGQPSPMQNQPQSQSQQPTRVTLQSDQQPQPAQNQPTYPSQNPQNQGQQTYGAQMAPAQPSYNNQPQQQLVNVQNQQPTYNQNQSAPAQVQPAYQQQPQQQSQPAYQQPTMTSLNPPSASANQMTDSLYEPDDFADVETEQPPAPVSQPPPPAPPSSSSAVYKAMYDYDAADDDEVSFRDGDIIINTEPIDDGWMYGTVQRSGQTGMLPSNYVERIQ